VTTRATTYIPTSSFRAEWEQGWTNDSYCQQHESEKNNQHSAKTNYYRIPPAKCNALSSVILGSEQKQSNQTGYLNEKKSRLEFCWNKKNSVSFWYRLTQVVVVVAVVNKTFYG